MGPCAEDALPWQGSVGGEELEGLADLSCQTAVACQHGDVAL